MIPRAQAKTVGEDWPADQAPPRAVARPTGRTRVFLAAQDRGAFTQVAAIARALQRRGHVARLAVPAHCVGAFDAGDLDVVEVPLEPRSRAEESLGRLVAAFAPDAMVLGISNSCPPSIEELAILAAPPGVATIAMQDFWGEVGRFGRKRPSHYLVLDAFAAAVTSGRTPAALHVVGSPKHAAYAALDRRAMRAALRRRVGADGRARVAGFFGQPLLHLGDAYRDTLRDLAAAVAADRGIDMLLYRPHPREDAEHIRRSATLLSTCGKLVMLRDGPVEVEPWLLASDVALSCFSTCGYDMLQLNRLEAEPFASVVYLNHQEGVDAYWRQSAGFAQLPPLAWEAALDSRSRPLAEALRVAQHQPARLDMHGRASMALIDPAAAPGRAADAVTAIARQAAALA